MRRVHLPALGGLLASTGGVLLTIAKHPELIASLPAKVGAAIVVGSQLVQAFTKPLPKSRH